MAFGFETLLGQMSPSGGAAAATATAPGKRPTTAALAPRTGANTDDTRRDGVGLATGEARTKDEHTKELMLLAARARNLRSQDRAPAEQCPAIAELISAAVAPTEALARLAAAEEEATGKARAQLDDAFFFAKQEAEDTLARRAADATPKNDAAAIRALDLLADVAHGFAAAAGSDPRAALPLGALGSLGVAAEPLGWHAPTSLQTAIAGRLERAPCGTEGRAEHPDQCPWSPVEREHYVAGMHLRLMLLLTSLETACAAESKVLSAAIQRDAKMAEAIADMVLDLLLSVAPKAVKSTAEVAVAKGVAEAGKEAAKKAKTMKDVLVSLRDDITDTLTKKYTGILKKKVTDAVAKGDDDPRQDTVTVIDQLPSLFQGALARIDDEAMSDDEVLSLYLAAENSQARVAAGVKRIVDAYRKNIEPLGQTRIAPGLPTGTRTTTISARLHPPAGGAPRLAMVKHTSDLDPKARKREAAPIVGLAEVAHGMHVISDETNAEVHERGADDGERYEFVHWIDAPAATVGIDIAGMADMDAIDLPMTRVTGLSLGDLAGPAR